MGNLARKGENDGMTMTDPVADMLTRIRNANTAGHEVVEIPASKMKKSIAQILLNEGYIKGFDVVEDNKQGIIKIDMKYLGKEKVISGLGIAIISTSNGVISDKEARKLGVGGEVICYVW